MISFQQEKEDVSTIPVPFSPIPKLDVALLCFVASVTIATSYLIVIDFQRNQEVMKRKNMDQPTDNNKEK
jgi:hypothetical protein